MSHQIGGPVEKRGRLPAPFFDGFIDLDKRSNLIVIYQRTASSVTSNRWSRGEESAPARAFYLRVHRFGALASETNRNSSIIDLAREFANSVVPKQEMMHCSDTCM